MKARRGAGAAAAALLSTALMLTSPAMAAGPGPGGGGGGGGGGEPTDTTGSLYSDLVIALREVDGTPILKKYEVPATAETDATIEYCVQPVSYEPVPGVPSSINPVDGRTVWVLPLQGEWIGSPDPLPVAEIEACDPKPQYAMFVKEVELERLNLTRTSEDVIARKLSDVQTKLRFADNISLESTGRIMWDQTPIDASPENAAMYQSLMKTGTIPGLPAAQANPAFVGPDPAQTGGNSRFDAWELAAMTVGAAASKSTPINIDTIEYYNQIIPFPPDDPAATPPVVYESPWGVNFLSPADPDSADTTQVPAQRFVDYSGFSYNRSETFRGSVTWLDVPTLTWKVSKITDVVPFTNLSSLPEIGDSTLHGITAFAQLADDVRAMCNFVPDNTFIPGFYMDVPGVDTTAAQLKAIHDPAVDLGTLPENVFKTYPFQITASLLNPFQGTQIEGARLRLTIDDPVTDFTSDSDITAIAADGQHVPFTVENGNLVGWWGPDTGFPVKPGYNVSTTFDVTVAGTAPSGVYNLTLDLVTVANTTEPLASESGTIMVNDDAAMVLWGDSIVKYATQGTPVKLPVQVYSPDGTPVTLHLTISSPGDDPLTTDVTETLAAGDVKVYASDGTDMVPMTLTLTGPDVVTGTWTTPALSRGSNPVTWYITVADGAPVGNYAFGVTLEGGNTLDSVLIALMAPETHGEQPPDAGEDTTPPTVTITPDGTLGATASFTLTANEDGVTYECQLTKDSTVLYDWAACTSPKTYTGLAAGSYVFSARGTDRVGLVSQVVTKTWVVEAPVPDTTPPVITIDPVGVPGSTATFTLSANEADVTFACQLTKNGRAGAWVACASPKTYTDLKPASYVFSARGTDKAGNSAVETVAWSVTKGGGGRPPKG